MRSKKRQIPSNRERVSTNSIQFGQIRYLFRLAHLTKWGRKRSKSALALLKTGVPNFENGEKARTNRFGQIIVKRPLEK